MIQEKIQFISTTPQELSSEISDEVRNHLDEFLKNFKPKPVKEYLSRKDVANMLDIDISTVHNWCKAGKLKPLGIGNRVYFLRSDVEKSVKPLNP
jgi:hypothetical protein